MLHDSYLFKQVQASTPESYLPQQILKELHGGGFKGHFECNKTFGDGGVFLLLA